MVIPAVVCPMASPMRSWGMLSTMTTRPITQTAAQDRPWRALARTNVAGDDANANRIVDAHRAARPRVNGSLRDAKRSEKYPNKAVAVLNQYPLLQKRERTGP